MGLLQELATEARQINAANGWGLDFDPNSKKEIPGYLALIHSEISEVWGARSRAEMRLELGDVVIRCLDLCELLIPGELGRQEARGIDTTLCEQMPDEGVTASSLMELHQRVTVALEVYRRQANFVPVLVGELLGVTLSTWKLMQGLSDAPPELLIREILDANRKRGYRHGGRRT